MPADRLGRRAGEGLVGVVQRLGGVGRGDQEHPRAPRDPPVDHGRVAVRTLDDLGGVAHGLRQLPRVARNDLQPLAGVQQVPDHVLPDVPGGRGDDDHAFSPANR